MCATFMEGKFPKTPVSVTIKFLENHETQSEQKIILIRENGEIVKKDNGEEKIFSLASAINAKSLKVNENVIRQENPDLYRIKDFFEKNC